MIGGTHAGVSPIWSHLRASAVPGRLCAMPTPRSHELLERASAVLPGGVNSPVRAFRAVEGEPVFIAEARGAYLTDVDGRRYVDYVGSWGPMIVGHAHPSVVAAVQAALVRGSSYGAPTPGEVELAERIREAYPS